MYNVSPEELVQSLKNYYASRGVSPSIQTHKCPDLFDQAVYKRVLECKTWSDVLKKAGLPVYFADKDAPLDDDKFIQFSIDFVKKNSIKNMHHLLRDRRFRSQEYIENHFGSVRAFAELIGMKMVDSKKTLAYAVAFIFNTSGVINFTIGNKMYQHINTIYDKRSGNSGFNTIEVVYNYKAMKHEALNVSDEKIGGKEIAILNN